MRVQTVIILAMVLFGAISIVTFAVGDLIGLLEATPQSGATEEVIDELEGTFSPNGAEQDGVIAQSGWIRTNSTTEQSYFEFNSAFEAYIQEDLPQAIQSSEGVTSVYVNLWSKPTNATENNFGLVYVRFQLDRDVYDDSKADDHITDWGWTINRTITDLLKNSWYVDPKSVYLGYAVPGGGKSADAGFTLSVMLVAFVFILLLIRRRKRQA